MSHKFLRCHSFATLLQVLEYEPNNRGEIQASCTAIGGRPAPTFHWFVDDSNNREIDDSELNARDNEWDDNGVPMLEQSIRSDWMGT